MNTIWKPSQQQFAELCTQHAKYQALAQLIEDAINQGELQKDQKLPAQRLLADSLNVTHGTVTRAYALLEKRGLAYAKLGAGTFIKKPLQAVDETENTDFASSLMPMMGQHQVLANQLQLLAQDETKLKQLMTYKLNGFDHHQAAFKHYLTSKGMQVENDSLIFCQGAQQGIYAALAALTKPDDVVVHESLCYPGFYQACDALGLNTQACSLLPSGLDLTELETLCKRHKVKAVYITPHCQNPTNFVYQQATLDGLLALSKRFNFYILEDDVNYCLPENWRLPLWQKAKDRVFYLGSFSKYFAGGLRAGFVIAPFLWQQAVLKQIHAQCWSVSMMNFELLAGALLDAEFARNQAQLAIEVQTRITLFKALLERFGLNANFAGLNVFLTLEADTNMFTLASELAANQVIVRTADVFSRQGAPVVNAIRFTLGGPSSRAAFMLGLKRVEQVLKKMPTQITVVI